MPDPEASDTLLISQQQLSDLAQQLGTHIVNEVRISVAFEVINSVLTPIEALLSRDMTQHPNEVRDATIHPSQYCTVVRASSLPK